MFFKLIDEKKRELGIFLFFFLVFFILHYYMPVISDDLSFRETFASKSFFEYLSWRYTHGAGKILTDSLGGILNKIPFFLWKFFDTLLWCGMIWLFISVFFGSEEKNESKQLLYILVGFLLLCYPYRYLSSAGYIFTSTNYIYTTFCVLFCVYFLLNYSAQKKCRFVSLSAALIFAAYAGSQEQSACVLFGLLLGVAILKHYRKEPIPKSFLIIEFLACAAVFLFMMSSPAHIARTSETTGRFCVPNFDNWSFSTKIIKGYTTTAAVTLFCPCLFYYIFIFFLFLCGLRKKTLVQKFLSALPVLESLVIFIIGSEWFVEYPDYGYGMPDIRVFYHGNDSMLFIYISLLIVLSVILAILASQETLEKAVILLFLAAVAFSSRIVMGFSATLFGSSFRTFTYLLFLLLAADLLLIKELYRDRKIFPIAITFVVLLAIISYADGFQSIIFM